MRKIALFLILLLPNFIYAQNEEKGFSFQGYARDFEGAALSKQTITVKFSIYPEGQSDEYVEEQTLETDAYGVFHAVVGSVAPVTFSKVDFGKYNYWLKVEVKAYGSSYVEISNTELLSVPYAKASEVASNGVPPGTILPFGGDKSKIPAGYLACDGSLVDKATYPSLYNAIGSAWGESGASFNVPDLRGYFLRGVSDGQNIDPDRGGRYAVKSGSNSGDNVGSYQWEEIKGHNHTFSGSTSSNGSHDHGVPNDSGSNVKGGGDDQVVDNDRNGSGTGGYRTSTDGAHAHSFSGTTATMGGSETRPKNAYVWFMIKY